VKNKEKMKNAVNIKKTNWHHTLKPKNSEGILGCRKFIGILLNKKLNKTIFKCSEMETFLTWKQTS